MGLPKIGVIIEASGEEGYAKALKSVASATDAASSSIDKASKSAGHLGNIFDIALGDLISGGVTKALSLVTNALGGILDMVGNIASGIFKSTVGFSQTMANISAVTGATGKDLKVLNDQILAVGADSAAGPQAVADAYYDVASGVLDASQRLDVLKAAVQASEAGQADLGATTEFLISEMNAYGKSAGGAAKVSDILTATVNKGVGRMDEFVHAMTPLAGLAAASKISLTDVGAALSYMTAKGVPAEQAATQLKAAMVQLSRNTPAVTRALKAMGEKSIEASIAAHGLGGTLDLVSKGAAKTHQNLTDILGSTEALQAALVLSGDEFQKYFDTFVDGVDGATAAARELQRADVSYQLKLIGSRFQAIGIMVGEAVLPAFNKFLTFLNTELANFDWKKIGAGLDKLGEKLGIAAGKIISAISTFLSNVDWEQVGTDIETALSNVGDFIAKIDWKAVIEGAGKVVTAVGDIVTKVGEVATAIMKLPAAFDEAVKKALISLAPLLSAIKSISDFFHNPTGAGGSGDTQQPGTTGMAGQGTTNSKPNQLEHAGYVKDYLNMPGMNAPSDVLAEAQTAIDAIQHPVVIPTKLGTPDNVTTFGDIFTGNNIVKIPATLKIGDPTAVGTDVKNSLAGQPPIEVPAQPKIDYAAFAADVSANATLLEAAGIQVTDSVTTGIKSGSPMVNHELGQTMTDAISGGKTAAAPAGSIGSGMTEGIAAAIRGGGGAVVGALSGVIADAIAAAKSQLAMHSPSKVFMGVGTNMMKGWQQGIIKSGNLPPIATAMVAQNVIGASGGGYYNDSSSRQTIYNLGLTPYQPNDQSAALQIFRG